MSEVLIEKQQFILSFIGHHSFNALVSVIFYVAFIPVLLVFHIIWAKRNQPCYSLSYQPIKYVGFMMKMIVFLILRVFIHIMKGKVLHFILK